MDSEWKTTSIGDVCEAIYDGPHATPKKTNEGPIFLGISNLQNGQINLSDAEYLSEEDFIKWTRRVTPRENDIVFSYETRLGEAAFVPKDLKFCLGRRMALMRPNTNKVVPRFLLYAYLGPEFQQTLHARTVYGSTVDRIPLIEFPSFPISLPPLSEQRAIVGILGALDDKIEVNRRMNATLESMARAVFRQWFVEGEDVVNWEVGTISDLAIVTSGKRPDARQDNPDNEFKYPLYGGGGIMAYANKSLYDFPILLTGRVGTLGLIFRITVPCWPSDNTLITIPNKPEYYEFLYFQLEQTDLKVLNRGSTQPLLTQTDLQKCSCVLPADEILFKFHNIVSPMFAKIDSNNEQSRTLASLRDGLLPKLMKGEVRVMVN